MPTAGQRRATAGARDRWRRSRLAESAYARQLRRIARAVGDIVRGVAPTGAEAFDPEVEHSILKLLERYAQLLPPWAEHVGQRMIEDVAARDFKTWMDVSQEIGVALRREIETAPTGVAMRAALADQVSLITSLPREAAERVHHLTTEARISGQRAESIADEILETGDVTRSRAELIARTEVMRTGTELLKARSLHIGAEEYRWVSAGDADVRKEHRRLNGKIFNWNAPPIAGPKGERYHPGSGPNCRCTAIPLLDESMFRMAA